MKTVTHLTRHKVRLCYKSLNSPCLLIPIVLFSPLSSLYLTPPLPQYHALLSFIKSTCNLQDSPPFSVSPYLTLSLFTSLSHFTSWFQWRMTPLKTSQHDGVTNCSNGLGKFQTDSHPSSISPFSHPHLSPQDYLGERNLEWPVSPNRPGDI